MTLEVLARQVGTQLELRRALAMQDALAAALEVEAHERRHAEHQLNVLNADLEQQVAERTLVRGMAGGSART